MIDNLTIASQKNLIMTLRQWRNIDILSIENIIMNSSSDRTDKIGDDAMIPEPIGICHTCTPKLIYDLLKTQKKEATNTALCAFRATNDKRRRSSQSINRENIKQTLSNNGIQNRNIGDNYFWKLLETKFVISPEGNGIDCHRHWESLYFGAIPIVEFNKDMEQKLKGLPVLYTTDFSEVNKSYLDNKYQDFLDATYDFSRLFLHNYSSTSQDVMIRRGNHWNSRRNMPLHWNINFDLIFSNFYDNVGLITITNSGYFPITKNCIKSIEKLHINCPIKIYSIDKDCYDLLIKEKYPQLEFLGDIQSDSAQYQDKNWSKVTMQKIYAIRRQLDQSNIVIYIDGDITVEDSRFITYCYETLTNNPDIDILAQSEWRGPKDNKEVCSGFMAIRSNEKTKKMFDVEPDKHYRNDQFYVNKKKKNVNLQLLPIELFPNGKFFYKNKQDINPYLIHFNFVMAHDKIKRIQTHNKWYM